MHATARKIRPIIKHIPGAWVRAWSDDEVRVGALHGQRHFELLKQALREAGISFVIDGEPGTVGEHTVTIIDVP